MKTDRADEAHGTPFVSRWEDSITVVEHDGKPVVVGREFGTLLDYADEGRQLVNLIIGDWSDEFIADVDYIVLRNGRLAAFKQLCTQLHLPLVDKRAPSLLLLTESGIQLVLARTEKPEGKIFRRWLVSECIPAYQATRALPGPSPTMMPAPSSSTRSTTSPTAPASPGVQVLRRVLERMRPAMEPGAYAALDALVEEVEDTTEATAAASSIDAIPVPRDRREGSATEDTRITLCGQASSALVGLRTDDLHRFIVWSATRPLRGQARRALATRGR